MHTLKIIFTAMSILNASYYRSMMMDFINSTSEERLVRVQDFLSHVTWLTTKGKFDNNGNFSVYESSNLLVTGINVAKLYRQELQYLGVTVHGRRISRIRIIWKPSMEQLLPAEISPPIREKLLPFQIPHVGRLLNAMNTYGSAIDMSDTGTGKTYSALAVAFDRGLFPIIVCPKSVIPSWEAAVEHFGHNPERDAYIKNYEKFRYGSTPYFERQDTISSRGSKVFGGSWNFEDKNPLLIWDEAHKLKNITSQQTKMAMLANVPQLFLSATIVESPLQLSCVGKSLSLFYNGDFALWKKNIGLKSSKLIDITDVRYAKILNMVNMQLNDRGGRMRIADAADFPECAIDVCNVDVGDRATRQIQKAYSYIGELVNEAEISMSLVLTELTRLRMQIELAKIPTVVSMCQEYVEQGCSVVIFLCFRQSITSCKKGLKRDDISIIWGKQTLDERQCEIDKFQMDANPHPDIHSWIRRCWNFAP